MYPQLLAAADRTAQSWRNGGGITFPVLAEPDEAAATGAFDWRVSIAQISTDGPFSEFAGVDRLITVLTGAGVELEVDGNAVELRPGVVLPFRGEAAVSARLIDGPTFDLNLMTTRGRATGRMRIEDADGLRVGGAAEVTVIVVVDGPVRCEGLSLDVLDALRLGPDEVTLAADVDARVAVIEIDSDLNPPHAS